jgi:alkyl hydroperoxide reductase subunit D
MTLDTLKERLPDWAKDVKLNLSSLASTPGLSAAQLWGTALASAMASRHGDTIAAFHAEAAQRLDAAQLRAAQAAAAIMAMNNVYYRFVHLCSNPEYGKLPARLRMQVIANHGVDKLDFELWSLAVSAINGCGACIDAHERELRSQGASAELVQNAVRIAAIVHSAAATLDAAAHVPASAG